MQYCGALRTIMTINTTGRKMHEVRLYMERANIDITCMHEIMVPPNSKWDDE